MRETFTNPNTGDLLATLDFRPRWEGAKGQVAKIDDGEIFRNTNGTVSVTIATRRGVRRFKADSVTAALIVYGLTTTHCNGLPDSAKPYYFGPTGLAGID